jgi:hypothetical protein
MTRIAALSLVLTVAFAMPASAQRPTYRELEEANLRHVVHSIPLRAKPGRSARRSLTRAELRVLADQVRAIGEGTPVIGVHLYGSGTYPASLMSSQAMASEIVRGLEALGIPRGRVLPFGFGANRRLSAVYRARARHPQSHVDLFVVPAPRAPAPIAVGAIPPNPPVSSPSPIAPAPQPPVVPGPGQQAPLVPPPASDVTRHVSALMSRAREALLACTGTVRDLTLTLVFDERGRVAGIAGPFAAGESRCFQRALVGQRIAPPGSRVTVSVTLRAPTSVPSPVRPRSARDILKGGSS